MTAERSSPSVERREQGLALSDALFADVRSLAPLPEVAHARVKRRLKASLRRTVVRRPRWLQPVLMGGVMLVCGGAFGIALDRFVLRRTPVVAGEPRSSAPADKPHVRRGKVRAPAPGPSAVAEPTPASPLLSVTEPALPAASPRGGPARASLGAPRPTVSAAASTSAAPLRAAAPAVPSSVGASAPPANVPLVLRPTAAGPPVLPVTPTLPALADGTMVPGRLAMRAETGPAGQAAASAMASPEPLPPLPPLAAAPSASAPAISPVELPPPSPPKAARPADRLSEERLLAAALRALRAQSDPPSALMALDEYRAHFPQGRLAAEAEVLRVETLVALHRPGEALAILDRMALGRMPGDRERQVQRGELRGSAGRWQEAQADFDKVLAQGDNQDPELAERALWGRAQSRARLGDGKAARLAVAEYLRRFPNGRFAARAKHLVVSDEARTH